MACALSSGCTHYQRKCKLVAPCWKKIYTCRVCHDDNESHVLNRKKIKEVQCIACSTKQPPRSNCRKCRVRFGKYCCLECNLFDDEFRGQFHCFECGICRVGGAENFFHCETCNMCLSITLLGNHKCVENRAHSDCPICMEDMHTSRTPLKMPPCGHFLHTTCFEDMKKGGHTKCPICKADFN